ncbi:MAG TPA: alpha/beta hydrolase [Verrucomicrobiae bacterium]|nr:alpha/beta hydrolase [Verrucomicrobiae bacterium]
MNVVHFSTEDGLSLAAWYKPAAAGKPTIVYFHGNAGNLLNHSWIARPLIDKGYGVLLLEYRGYGGNPGTPAEEGLYQDGDAAVRFLESLGLETTDLVFFGQSLGTGVAVEMALRFPPKALILQSPYTSVPATGQHHYWYVPVKWLAKDRFDSAGKVNRIKSPLLVVYAEHDNIIPGQFSVDLFTQANEPKTLVAIPEGGHNDVAENGALTAVIDFMETL